MTYIEDVFNAWAANKSKELTSGLHPAIHLSNIFQIKLSVCQK